ncbi:(S)-citramalyl-CoA lyase [Pseudomonas sp. NFACC02]|uniref:HpcH/HpaI aldolase/citrate lyase family protein n=1 Tax=Pseudomonas sp. NFACC02 TaxID=1566250 RepID=UPI0008BCB625|nr:CoA ester lyase [Pseudomonas sp. NFACC02]SER72969.1 (S)-citramalyl-CoA lyase [Pseudomonas sp. NFACC02]
MEHKTIRSALFVPGDRPERFAKALASGADVVIVDLEDAVEESQKIQAREHLLAFLDNTPEARVWVRVNMASHVEHDNDLQACRHSGVEGIFLPKAESRAQVQHAVDTGKSVIPIIESALGLAALPAMAKTSGVLLLTYGRLDLGLDLGLIEGSQGAERMLDHVRYELLLHSRLADLAMPLESVVPSIDNAAGLEQAARAAADMGFAGLLCIHPKQVAVVHAALRPSEADLDWAERVIAACDGRGAFRLDGAMIDAPVIARAHRLLALRD